MAIEVRTITEHIERYEIQFWDNKKGGGFGFPCDKDGKLIEEGLTAEARKNYEWCMDNKDKFDSVGFNDLSYDYKEHRAICKCGKEIEIYDQYRGACECPHCGRWFNLFGQELNPPDQWEEEFDDGW